MVSASPFHAGGSADAASAGGAFIRDAMPERRRRFFAALPFLVVTGGGVATGRIHRDTFGPAG